MHDFLELFEDEGFRAVAWLMSLAAVAGLMIGLAAMGFYADMRAIPRSYSAGYAAAVDSVRAAVDTSAYLRERSGDFVIVPIDSLRPRYISIRLRPEPRVGEMEFEFRAAREDFVRESADDDSGAVARR